MIWKGYKRVSLKSIVCDAAEIRRRMKQQHVVELARDIQAAGEEPIHAPTINAKGSRLLCGRDRFAAAMLNKLKKLWVHIARCDDAEAKELELRENIYRRTDNRSALLAQLADLREQHLRAESQADSSSPLHGASDQTIRSVARKDTARAANVTPGRVKQAQLAAGIKPAAVRKAEQRAAKDSAVVHGPSPGAPAVEAEEAPAGTFEAPTLDLLGCDDFSGRAVMKYARKDQEAIDEADKYLRLAQTALTRMTPGTAAQQLHAQVHRVASLVRSARPEFICPWCKGLPKAEVPACAPCGGAGYVSHEVAGRSPPELRNEDAPMVAIDGKFYPYADVRDGKTKPAKNGKPTKAEKRISVTTVEGDEADLDAV